MLNQLTSVPRLVARLLYGTGLGLQECLEGGWSDEAGWLPHVPERVDMVPTFQRLSDFNGNCSCPATGRGSLWP